MNHKQRRVAAYKAMGMAIKAECAAASQNNRSRRARGKMRQSVGWVWRELGHKRFKVAQKMLTYGGVR